MKKGFTLIELIAVLLLVSILALSATVSLLPVAEAFMQAGRNADSAQKARLAMTRLAREFTTITNVVSGGETLITYQFLDPSGGTVLRTVSWGGSAGDSLQLNDIDLSDDVRDFELHYLDAPGGPIRTSWQNGSSTIIAVTLESFESGGRYTNHVAPRNIIDGG